MTRNRPVSVNRSPLRPEPVQRTLNSQPLETQICVFVDPAKTFQTILGIGGALTDAAAEAFAKLPKAKQQEVLDAYFDPSKGIGYTLAASRCSITFVRESFPDTNLIFTEGCDDAFAAQRLSDWKLGEQYGRLMINGNAAEVTSLPHSIQTLVL